ncbi:hypothetical protein [Sporosarcina sp. JAI121]|nr:hypothetical protein [Sporosarcina sp. JAI121]NYF24813.1 hypothetical protein [Sporosarcina sp. JAI121]
MINVLNLQAVVDDHHSRVKPKRMTSGQRRVLSLQKEDSRLNGQKI